MRHLASRTKRREVPLGLRAVRFLGFFVGLSGNAECGRSVKELQDTTEHFHKAFDCLLNVSVPSLPAGGKTRGGFHKTAPYELHGSVSRLTLSDNAQHNSAAAML